MLKDAAVQNLRMDIETSLVGIMHQILKKTLYPI